MSRWVLIASLLLVGGCGSGTEATLPATLTGAQVGSMAERQLEHRNPGLERGTLTCPDLDLRVGAKVRCVRRTELDGGRVVRIGGTVEVTSRKAGGRLHVLLDDEPIDFGLTSAAVTAEVARRTKMKPVHCPALPGRVGVTATCTGASKPIRLRVTGVDVRECRTSFVVIGVPAR